MPLSNGRYNGPYADAAAWGVAYVLEGSRLGGRVLARRAAAGGHPLVAGNMRFLRASPAIAWADFLQRMEAALASTRDTDGAIEGARTAFSLFELALARVAGPHEPARTGAALPSRPFRSGTGGDAREGAREGARRRGSEGDRGGDRGDDRSSGGMPMTKDEA